MPDGKGAGQPGPFCRKAQPSSLLTLCRTHRNPHTAWLLSLSKDDAASPKQKEIPGQGTQRRNKQQ